METEDGEKKDGSVLADWHKRTGSNRSHKKSKLSSSRFDRPRPWW